MTKSATATTNHAGDDGALELVTSLAASLGAGVTPRLVCVWASTKQPLAALLSSLAARLPHTTVVGSSTCGEFTGAGETAGTAVAFALAGDFVVEAGLGTGLKANSEAAIHQAVASLKKDVAGHPHKAAIVLFDGLAGVGEEATLQAAMILGEDVKVAGAAAADDWAVTNTVVGAGNHSASDAVVVCMIHSRSPIGLGVRHGHEPFSETVTVTKSKDSIVYELDGQPAWERYSALARTQAANDQQPDPASWPDASSRLQLFARYSPAVKVGAAWRNRTAIMKNDDGSLAFTCGIPEGSHLTILASDPDKQLVSARRAAKEAVADLNGAVVKGALVFDCACRKVLLGDRFNDAVSAIGAELGVPLCGFESYGEVALRVGDFSGFHNATTVVLTFSE